MDKIVSEQKQAGALGGLASVAWGQWYSVLEANRRIVVSGLILVCLLIMLGSALRNPVDHDSYWHAQMGEDLIKRGLTPYEDRYSFTHKGEAVKGPPVVFQVWLFQMEDMLGETAGMVAVKLTAFYAVFLCLCLWLRQLKAPVLVYVLALPMLVLLLQTRSQVRPELFSYSFSIIALMLYWRANLRLSASAILPVAFLLVLWTNYHVSILGYIIFFGLFVDIAIRLIKESAPIKEWARWCAWGMLLVVVGFLNHDITHPAISALTFPDYWKTNIKEYLPPLEYYDAHWSILYFMLPLALITLVVALRSGMYGYVIIGGVILYSVVTIARMVTPGGIILIGIFAGVFSLKLKQWLKEGVIWRNYVVGLVSAGILVAVMWENVGFARFSLANNQSLLYRYPVNLVDYMRTQQRYGRIFNEYAIGGYLIERLYPDVEVYIDGRTNMLYAPDFFQTFKMARYDAYLMGREIRKYNINHVVLGNKPFDAAMMSLVPGFNLDYVDVTYSLYTKDNPGLAKTGELWARPSCWQEENLRGITAELDAIKPSLYSSAPIIPVVAIAADYSARRNKLAWLDALEIDKIDDDVAKRFAAYRALELGKHEIAAQIFTSLKLSVYSDSLALAFAHARLQQFEYASDALIGIFEQERDWWMFLPKDFVVMSIVMEMVSSGSGAQVFDEAFSDKILAQVGGGNFHHSLYEDDVEEVGISQLFCRIDR